MSDNHTMYDYTTSVQEVTSEGALHSYCLLKHRRPSETSRSIWRLREETEDLSTISCSFGRLCRSDTHV